MQGGVVTIQPSSEQLNLRCPSDVKGFFASWMWMFPYLASLLITSAGALWFFAKGNNITAVMPCLMKVNFWDSLLSSLLVYYIFLVSFFFF